MKSLSLKNFKAYKETAKEFNINFDKKHFLLYGDNGAGKSSLYEAIKVAFHKEKIEPNIPVEKTPEEKVQILNDFWNSYVSRHMGASEFELKINNKSYKEFDAKKYLLHMVSYDDIYIGEYIQWSKVLERVYFTLDMDEGFYFEHYQEIQENINHVLSETFQEDFVIAIDAEDDFRLRVTDATRNLDYKKGVKNYFNEAKLNLIVLLLVFESIKKKKGIQKKNILVLDDFITSLDVANRTFMMKYIFDNFESFQILIFTHNIYLYNLIMYIINTLYQSNSFLNSQKWNCATLYEIAGVHKLYMKNTSEKVSKIVSDYETSNNIDDIGNRVRQKFEILLYEVSKLLSIGAVEESAKIIEKIINKENIYIKCDDLVEDIESIVNQTAQDKLKDEIQDKVNSYKYSELHNLKEIIKNMKLYQKVTLHPMSHGTEGITSFTQKELEASINLLKELEITLDRLKKEKKEKVDGM